jgi:hypothetical protein
VIQKKPDTVFIEFAINDAVAGRNVSIEQARVNLEDMIDRLLKSNSDCEIILMTMNSCVGQHKARRPDLASYYQMYRDVAEDRRFQLIDHYPVWEKLLNENPGLFIQYVPDGIHPVREGAIDVIMPTMIQSLGLKQGKPELNERTACWNYLFGTMDKLVKRDKQVTREGYDRHWEKQFKMQDGNKDNLLKPEEYKPAVLFRHIDVDKNAEITLEEYQSIYAPCFQRHDVNADGMLDGTEIWRN